MPRLKERSVGLDEEDVDPVHRGDGAGVGHGFRCLDLGDAEQPFVGMQVIFLEVGAEARCPVKLRDAAKPAPADTAWRKPWPAPRRRC